MILPTRDFFGIEPLYFDRATGATSDSLHHFDLRDPDPVSVTEYLAFGECWREDATFLAGVGRLPPAAQLDFPYILPGSPIAEIALVDRAPRALVSQAWDELVGAVGRAIGDATEVVVSLSGGLDSPALAVAAVELLGRDRVRAVTSGCVDDFHDLEPVYAARVAKHLGLDWTFVCADRTDLMVDWPVERIWPADPLSAARAEWDRAMPGQDGVILWGLGGDSLQRGDHEHYRRRLKSGLGRAVGDVWNAFVHGQRPGFGVRRAFGAAPRFERPSWMNSDAPGFAEVADLRTRTIPSWRRGVDELRAPVWSYCFEAEAPQNTRRDARYVYPFFDEQLARFWASVPTVPWCIDKELLRAALRGRVPEEIRLRDKSPVVGEPLVTVRPEVSERLRGAVNSGAGNPWFKQDEVCGHLTPGVHAWSALEPFVRCASVARWVDSLG